MIDINKIKLVIWDLDDTFWKGTLSEGPIESIDEHIQLVKALTDRGIVNTICSKNDYVPTVSKLEELGINEYFVFKSIDWSPKGQRINQLINEMGLRPVNCLFLDDNVVNLNEAQFYSKELMTAEPAEIKYLISYCERSEITDPKHKRLNQYKVLEEKQKAKAEAGDNLQFLYASNTKVVIHKECKPMADRIFELINRTNQLNFTKYRCSREELDSILDDKDANCGYVTVKDNFGDYGIVGFYAIKDNKCIHFLFSCRTIGQGVEQWVYSTLGCPELNIIGEVVNTVKCIDAPAWINQNNVEDGNVADKSNLKIVFKGACDLCILSSYLISNNIVEEFTYVGEKGNSIEHHNHSINYLSFHFLSDTEKKMIMNDCIFADERMFDTAMYDKDVSLLFLSTQIEAMLGVYKHKETGYKIAFGEYVYPLTSPNNWDGFIRGELPGYQNKFSLAWLKEFSAKYEYIGRVTPKMFLENLKLLLQKLPESTKICLILGSEMPYEANDKLGYVDRHLYYKEINDLLREFVKTTDRIYLLDFNDYLKKQSDFFGNINHYQRDIYYKASIKANEYIMQVTGEKLKQKSIMVALSQKFDQQLHVFLHNLLFRIGLRKSRR